MSNPTDRGHVFPYLVVEHAGLTLTIEESTGRQPHHAPPGHLEVWLRRPEEPDGKPGAHMTNGSICQFVATFDADEEITKTQVERNELKAELKETKATERGLRKEMGQLKACVKELEAEVAKKHTQMRSDFAKIQIKALQRSVVVD